MSSCSPVPTSPRPATLRLVADDPADADARGDRRRAFPTGHETVLLRPVRERPAPGTALMTWGGAIAVVSSGFAVVLGVLVGRIDGARADLALGGAMGDDRSQALVTAAQLSALGVVLGLVLLVAGGLVRLAPRLRR